MAISKILFLMQLPPPVHGASVVNKSIQDSNLINTKFKTHYVNISPAKDLADIGQFSCRKVLSFFAIFFRSVYFYLKFKPDLVYLTLSPHGLAFYKDGLIAVIIKVLGGKLVYHLHGKGIGNEIKKSFFKQKLYRWVFKEVDIIHLAESLFMDIAKVRDHSRTVTAIANGIDSIEFTATIQKDPIFTFVYLSNLIRSKGADIVIRATQLIDTKYQNYFQVKIVGKHNDEVYFRELEELIIQGTHQNIKLLGPRYGKDKIQELCSAHVFTLPTRFKNECFPLSILEAMAAGLTVISTNEGAIAEIIDHGVTGEILSDASPAALADAMIKHITNKEYSEACAQSGREKFLSTYTQDIFEKKLALTLEQILERS